MPIHEQELEELETQYVNDALHRDGELLPYYTTSDGTAITDESLYVNHVPHWHYQEAISGYNHLIESSILDHIGDMVDQLAEAVEHEPDRELDYLTDGGSRTQYFWSGGDGILYHTKLADDKVDPFFDTQGDAGRFIELQAEKHGKDQYMGMVLRKSGHQKVAESVEYITDQSGLTDF